jgi:hypothetical protein
VRFLVLTNSWSMNIPVAPESSRASTAMGWLLSRVCRWTFNLVDQWR